MGCCLGALFEEILTLIFVGIMEGLLAIPRLLLRLFRRKRKQSETMP